MDGVTVAQQQRHGKPVEQKTTPPPIKHSTKSGLPPDTIPFLGFYANLIDQNEKGHRIEIPTKDGKSKRSFLFVCNVTDPDTPLETLKTKALALKGKYGCRIAIVRNDGRESKVLAIIGG